MKAWALKSDGINLCKRSLPARNGHYQISSGQVTPGRDNHGRAGAAAIAGIVRPVSGTGIYQEEQRLPFIGARGPGEVEFIGVRYRL